MLNRAIKLILCLFIALGCNECKNSKKRNFATFNTDEIREIRLNSITQSQFILGETEYWRLYNRLNDSVSNWIKNNLESYCSLQSYEIDSILGLNKEGNKFVSSIHDRCISKTCVQEYITYLYGVKIKGQWYFFDGPTMVLPREYYQEDTHTPLSFDKLRQIATDYIYRRYLIKTESDSFKINEDFTNDLESGAWCVDCTTQAKWDSAYINQVNLNWSKKCE